MEFLSDKQPGKDLRAALLKKDRRPVLCAISYIGDNAIDFLPLRKGDSLVCDAEEITIKGGSTVPESLDAFFRKGVKVYSCRGLHAKVVAGSRTAWIGSANASASSSRKVEASIRLSDVQIVNDVRAFIESLIQRPDARLRRKDIDALLRLERRKGFKQGSDRDPEELPESLSQLKVVFFEPISISAADEKLSKWTRKEALKERSKLGTRTALEDFWTYGETKLRRGDWFIQFNHDKVLSPCLVLSVHARRKGKLLWTARPEVDKGEVSQTALEEFIQKKLPPRALESVLPERNANRVLDFFRS